MSFKDNSLTPEEWNELDRMFELTVSHLSQVMTPDFSKEDWMELYRRSKEGDMTSVNLLMSLFNRKGKRYLEIATRHMEGILITDEEREELRKIREDN